MSKQPAIPPRALARGEEFRAWIERARERQRIRDAAKTPATPRPPEEK